MRKLFASALVVALVATSAAGLRASEPQAKDIVDTAVAAGGVGMRRGRRDPETCVAGDPIDFWRVEACEPDHLLRLEAEMKVPGRAWLEFTVDPESDTTTRIRQIARFEPSGLFGRLYWYSLLPAHAIIFSGMLRRIGTRATATRVIPVAGRT